MSKNLYVGNLNYGTTEDTLRTLFSEFGEVQTVNVITDRYTGRPRGFAFVEMATEEGADAAVAGMNGKVVDQRELKVDKAKPQAPRERRSGGGGGYGGDRDRRGGGGGGYGDRDRSERRGRW